MIITHSLKWCITQFAVYYTVLDSETLRISHSQGILRPYAFQFIHIILFIDPACLQHCKSWPVTSDSEY